MSEVATMKPIRRTTEGYAWEGVSVLAYKDGEGPYLGVTRQTLFEGHEALGAQWRYFEVRPGGHTTLERHEHIHHVMVVRGGGHCLVGDAVHEIALHDLVHVPAMTWHQFRATGEAPLGFLCLVNAVRDRPQLPTAEDIANLSADAAVAAFIRP